MKRKFFAILPVTLFLAGFVILLYPTFSDLYSRWQYQQWIREYERTQNALDYSALWSEAESYNEALTHKANQFVISPEEKTAARSLLNPLGTGMMGHITIDKIHLSLPIYQGTEERSLQSGAGWWIGTSLPTGGPNTHCVITAHTGLAKAKMFTDLDRLEIGDTFTVSILDRVMTYEVDQILITEPEDHTPLYIQPGQDLITLYTCTPYGINSHRRLVRGHRRVPSNGSILPRSQSLLALSRKEDLL